MRAESDVAMPLSGHLDELRSRLIRILIAVAIVFALTYNWADLVFAFSEGFIGGDCPPTDFSEKTVMSPAASKGFTVTS